MIEVRAHESLGHLDLSQMRALNLGSARASLFTSPSWLGHFLAHDEDLLARLHSPWILAAYEGSQLKGYLPLKSTRDRLGRRLSSLITVEVARPWVVAAPEDEQRVTHAFFAFLLAQAEEWDLVEFFQQHEGSTLFPGPAGLTSRHWLRRLPDRENNVLALPFTSTAQYAASLSKNTRHAVKKQLKALLSLPGLTVMTARSVAGRSALFEVFLDVERRSWKARGGATMSPRVPTYRAALADPSLEVVACVASLDGLPIAASVWLHHGPRSYHLQTTYSEAHEHHAPGALMLWLPVGDAIARRSVELDMLPDFNVYKARWGVQRIDTQRVQIFRVGSLRHLKGLVGDLKRRVVAEPDPKAPPKNPYKEAAARSHGPAAAADLPRLQALLAAARAAGAVEQDGATIAAAFPFS